MTENAHRLDNRRASRDRPSCRGNAHPCCSSPAGTAQQPATAGRGSTRRRATLSSRSRDPDTAAPASDRSARRSSHPLVREVCAQLDITVTAAAVGVSFGGMQAVHVANDPELHVPDWCCTAAHRRACRTPTPGREAIGGPILFSPILQGLVWGLVHRVVRSDAGLRRMLAPLSTLPIEDWWEQLSSPTETRHGCCSNPCAPTRGSSTTSDRVDRALPRPAVRPVERPLSNTRTGSRHDGGVSFATPRTSPRAIPGAVLVELESPSHLFWIGPGTELLASTVRSFIGGVAALRGAQCDRSPASRPHLRVGVSPTGTPLECMRRLRSPMFRTGSRCQVRLPRTGGRGRA